MTAATALVLGGMMTSCTHDTDVAQTASQDIIQQYEKVFTTAFGTPAPNQTWGFGESSSTVANTRAFTRSLPTKPSFSSQNEISEPLDKKPSSTKTFYNTIEEAKNAGVTITDAKGATIKDKVNDQTLEIDSRTSLNELQNSSNVTLYIADNMTFNLSFSSSGNAIVVTKDKTLTMSSINEKVEVYLAPGAKLKFTNDISVERGFYLYMSSESTLETEGNLTIKNGSWIVNHGGTIKIGTEQNKKSLTLENNCILWNENAGDKHGSVTVYKDLSTSNDGGIIYNASNCSIKASKLSLNKLVTLWDAGTIDISNEMICVNDYNKIRVTNGASLEVGSLELINNNDLLTNEGTLISSGEIKLHNAGPELDNYGILQGASMKVDAGAKFHNIGPTTITGKTYVYNTNGRWMNDDTFICNEFEIDGGSNWSEPFVFNNCKLIVNGKFHQNHGYFVLDGGEEVGASVVCDSFEWTSDNFFLMGSKSLLKVKGELLGANRNSSPEYGFHGEGDDYAVIQAGSVKKDSEGKYRVAYYGNLYVDSKNHFEQGQASDGPWYYHDTSVKFSFDDPKDQHKAIKAPVSIPAKGCSPGYKGDDNKEADPDVIRIIAEDLTWGSENGDFDFNDVVFDVSLSDDKETITITLRAAGGTLPLRIAGNDDFEVHKKFGVPTGTIVNTGTALSISKPIQTWSFPNRDTRNYTLVDGKEVAQTYGNTVEEVAYNLPVEVYKLVNGTKVWVELQAPVGKAAAKVAVDNTYDWCDERESIDAKYYDSSLSMGKFSMYVRKQAPYAEDNSWYK